MVDAAARRAARHRPTRHTGTTAAALALALAVLAAACSSGASSVADIPLTPLGGGDPTTLAAYRGQPLVVNLWAAWCTPCRTEMPLIDATAARDQGKVAVVGVTSDDNQSGLEKVVADTGVHYPILRDDRGRLSSQLHVVGLPTTLAFDSSGRLVDRHDGIVDQAELDHLIQQATGEASTEATGG